MAEKPRVKAPKQRATTVFDDPGRTRKLLLVGGTLAALVVVAVLYAAVGRGGGGADDASVRADLEAVGCTLKTVKALPGRHSISDPGGTSDKWNTDPPTNGPHYGQAAIFGIYQDELEAARVIHNLEHGGIFIQYGKDVPRATIEELKTFYDGHQKGTLLAPLPSLGSKVALGVWTTPSPSSTNDGTAHVAKCTTFDEKAYAAFFDAYQFKGPERFPQDALLPGS